MRRKSSLRKMLSNFLCATEDEKVGVYRIITNGTSQGVDYLFYECGNRFFFQLKMDDTVITGSRHDEFDAWVAMVKASGIERASEIA